MVRRVLSAIVVLVLAAPLYAITTKSMADGLTVAELAAMMAGPGATISNVTLTGAGSAIGTFTNGGNLGLADGIILSTGNISDAAGPNGNTGSGVGLGAPGHPALDAIVAPFKTHDAAVIEFDVVTATPTFSIQYVFASEEYREYVDSEFNDVFAFFVDGGNIALTPGAITPITINTINHLRNTNLYRDNGDSSIDTQFDGMTTVLTAVAVVEPNVTHHVRIAIADTSDDILDSAVIIARGGISGVQIAPVIVPTTNVVTVNNLESVQVPLDVFYANVNTQAQLTSSGLPEDSSVSFTPFTQDAQGFIHSTMTVNVGPTTPAGTYVVTITSHAGEATSSSIVNVVVNCTPPVILGTGQPVGQSVASGTRATLNVTAQGSSPKTYQWYTGYTGMTFSPITGATGPTLLTPPLGETTPFWVRVTTPCGSTDSAPAFVTVH